MRSGCEMPISVASEAGTAGRVRWGICALLFFATTINYIDRSVLGILAPTLRTEIGWTDLEYGRISAAFTLAYAIGFIFEGWLIDRIGTRIDDGPGVPPVMVLTHDQTRNVTQVELVAAIDFDFDFTNDDDVDNDHPLPGGGLRRPVI